VFRRFAIVMALLGTLATSLVPSVGHAQSGGGKWNGSIIANDGWRVEVVAAAQGPSISDADLDRSADGEWLLVVADATNWTGDAGALPMDDLTVGTSGGNATGATGTVLTDLNLREGPALDALILTGMPAGATVEVTGEAENGFYPVIFDGLAGYASVDGISVEGDAEATGGSIDADGSATAALALDISDGGDDIDADATVRVAMAFQLAVDADGPVLTFGSTLPLSEALAAEIDLTGLGDVQSPELAEVTIDEVNADGTLMLDDGTAVALLGAETPERGACFSGQAMRKLNGLVDGTVALERAAGTGDDPVTAYLWREESGERTLINHELIAAGLADSSFDGQDDQRLSAWFDATRQQAEDDETGLWGECTGFNGEERPEPTVAPTATPDAAEVRAEYPVLSDVREIAIRPGSYIGDEFQFTGRIFGIQVAGPGQIATLGDQRTYQVSVVMQVFVVAPDGTEEPVFIGYDGNTTGMFEGTYVTIYGTVVGTQSGTNGFGGAITQPLVIADIIDLA